MKNNNKGKCGHVRCAGGNGCLQKGPYMQAYKKDTIRCNNCDRHFIDVEDLEIINDKGDFINACPTCKTDEYLMDITIKK